MNLREVNLKQKCIVPDYFNSLDHIQKELGNRRVFRYIFAIRIYAVKGTHKIILPSLFTNNQDKDKIIVYRVKLYGNPVLCSLNEYKGFDIWAAPPTECVATILGQTVAVINPREILPTKSNFIYEYDITPFKFYMTQIHERPIEDVTIPNEKQFPF